MKLTPRGNIFVSLHHKILSIIEKLLAYLIKQIFITITYFREQGSMKDY